MGKRPVLRPGSALKLEQIISSRRTIHEFQNKKVPDEWLREGLALALMAPNHKLTHPWLFVEAGPAARSGLTELAMDLAREKDGALSDAKRAFIIKTYSDPDRLMVFAQRISADERERQEDYATLSCSIQNFCLSLWEKGVGTKWASGAITRHPRAYELLQIDLLQFAIVGFIWVGWPQVVPKVPRRPGVDEVYRKSP